MSAPIRRRAILRRRRASAVPAALALVAAGCGLDPGLEDWPEPIGPAVAREIAPREPCADRDPLRRPFFGDLHVHTGVSMDARSLGTTTTPDDAYRYARGETVALSPFDDDGRPERRARLARPLDFAAVTDHAEWMAETALCLDPTSEVFGTRSCRLSRGEEKTILADLLGLKSFRAQLLGVVDFDGRNREVCGEDLGRCRARLATVWEENGRAAERFYDRSAACSFTTFHAWEYSRSTASTKIHRNIILRNEIGPELPFSWIDTPNEDLLRDRLRDLCLDTGTGCEAIAIPHNPNLSNGHQFSLPYWELPLEEQREKASLRARLEPIVEMMQVKGESECRNGFAGILGGEDEFCGFEKIRDWQGPVEDCGDGVSSGAQRGKGCTSRLDYVRYALIEGLAEETRLGVNPLAFGFVGSTDTHRGTPGAADEFDFVGKYAASSPAEMVTIADRRRPRIFRNPGGLAGVWAEENSRDALFDAMKRRETFATSGPRIAPRFFAGFDLPEGLCEAADGIARADAAGVAMGGELVSDGGTDAPRFFVSAMQDAGTPAHPGTPLQRIQIVKGWVDDAGAFHQSVVDVAGGPDAGAGVDPDTCEPEGQGAASLCSVWRDPDFDPARPAVYYARVLERPSCRWSTWVCLSLPEAERPDGCSDPRVPKTIQERAWTSPIWVGPADSATPVASAAPPVASAVLPVASATLAAESAVRPVASATLAAESAVLPVATATLAAESAALPAASATR
ncbi:MAG: DUF3604 domain-containing protein [Myxococcota bacterium]